jgi:polygalacturonase
MNKNWENVMKASIIFISPVSCSIEVVYENSPYFGLYTYQVLLNDEIVIQSKKENVFSLYDLNPNHHYQLTIAFENQETIILEIDTPSVSQTIHIENQGFQDYSELIQQSINKLEDNGLLVIHEGKYEIKPLFLRDNITIYLKEGCEFIANVDRNQYPILEEYHGGFPLGTWEGNVHRMFASILTGINCKNVSIVGKGILDGNAQKSDWWIDHKKIRGAARPRMVFFNACSNMTIQGLRVKNSPSWTLHPYYSEKISFIDMFICNPKISPNTDGCNPESCNEVRILGCHFSVGDDCIAIKSGKIDMTERFYRPCRDITIRNCLMEDGHGAIVLGSEISSGVMGLVVNNCLFINTDRGLRIKTRRGRGNKSVIDQVLFENIKMSHVSNAFVINMFYKCDSDGCSDYVQSKSWMPVDHRTPLIGEVTFRNIICEDTLVSAGYFYGLPEQKIKQIEFDHVSIQMKDNDIMMEPAMMCGIEPVNQIGSYFNNVNRIIFNHLTITNQKGEEIIINHVDEIIKSGD